jgi:hypothetical protein
MREKLGEPKLRKGRDRLRPVSDPLDRFAEFARCVQKRLEAGRAAYGDRNFEASPTKLIGEIEEELLDVMGWTYVLWQRLRALHEIESPALNGSAEATVNSEEG